VASHRILQGIPLPKPFCQSFHRGHNVHWMQARQNQKRPRHQATLEIIDSTTVIVNWLEESKTLHNHCVAGIAQAVDLSPDGFMEFNPIGNLLYIRKLSDNPRIDEFFVAYLTTEEVSECFFSGSGSE
jgi:hypothetical protein